MEYCSLMSGSWGNCHYIKGGATSVLVDAGQSGKRILTNMASAGCGSATELSAIILTHAHRDHIAGAGVLARRFSLAVYATEGTWFEMGLMAKEIPAELRHIVDSSETWDIGDLRIQAYPTSHDALESVGFVIRHGEDAMGIATDCGVFTSRMENTLRDIQFLALEANHDIEMLRTGKYPYYLKKRIAGISGHLSNDDAGQALSRIAGGRLQRVMLAHLSQENNTREKALASVSSLLPGNALALSVAPRCIPGERIIIGQVGGKGIEAGGHSGWQSEGEAL